MNSYIWTIIFIIISVLIIATGIFEPIETLISISLVIGLNILKTLVDIHDELKIRHVL